MTDPTLDLETSISPRDMLLAGIREELLEKPPVKSTRASVVGVEAASANAELLARKDWERAERAAERKGLRIHLVPEEEHKVWANSRQAAQLTMDFLDELRRAQRKFPKSDGAALAWIEEVGEAASEILDARPDQKRAELIQVMAMCARLILEPCPVIPGTERHHVDLLVQLSDAGEAAQSVLESLT